MNREISQKELQNLRIRGVKATSVTPPTIKPVEKVDVKPTPVIDTALTDQLLASTKAVLATASSTTATHQLVADLAKAMSEKPQTASSPSFRFKIHRDDRNLISSIECTPMKGRQS